MKTAAAYIRVSTDDQVEYSPASQLDKIRQYAKAHDYILPDEFVFVDEGISGRSTQKRVSFNKMIGAAKQKPKPFDVILLWKFSRFARNREDSIVYKSMLRKQCGIEVLSISENVGDDKMSILIEALIEAMDEYYSINLGEEVKRGMTEKVSRGEAVTIPSLGYNIENGTYVPDPVTAPLIKRIFYDFLNGIPMRTLAMQLNNEGHRTRRGNLFENRTIQYILRNPVYIGKIRWTPSGKVRRNFNNPDTLIIDGAHEPLIDENTWQDVQEKLDTVSAVKYRRHTTEKVQFMLKGLVRCSNCGSTLSYATDGRLQCCAYNRGACRVSHSTSIKSLNDRFIQTLELSAITGDFMVNISPTKKAEAPDFEKLVEKEKAKLDRIYEAFENGVYSVEDLKKRRRQIDDNINKLDEQKKSFKTTVTKQDMNALRNKILDLLPIIKSPLVPEADKNELLKSFVEKIVYHRSTNNIDLFFYV